MVESFVPGAIETGTNINSLSEASEQDMVRVSESMQKAQQMSAQIRDDQKHNMHIAQFLTYLFSAVQDEELWVVLVELFSRPDANSGTMSLAVHEMVALFLPFYAVKANEIGLHSMFHVPYEIALAEQSYVSYIKQLYSAYPLYNELDRDTFSLLIAGLLVYHRISVIEEGKTINDYASHIRSLLA